jgi:exodeoxyribonuclease V alpha subunit
VVEVMAFLRAHRVSASTCERVVRHYGPRRALAVVQRDPYRLALDVSGIGWKTADALAVELGVADDAPTRTQAGVLHVMHEITDRHGHAYVEQDLLVDRAKELLWPKDGGLLPQPALVRDAVAALAAAEHLHLEPLDGDDGQDWLFQEARRGRVAVSLPNLHAAEARIAARLRSLVVSGGRRRGDVKRLGALAEAAIRDFEAEQGMTLAPEQREAVRLAAEHPVLVVTGGPGCGKTTLTRAILQMFSAAGYSVSLCAPTGRAARRLTEATGVTGPDIAQTIHRLLEWDPRARAFTRTPEHPLEADVVVCDEGSMGDLEVVRDLLDATADGTRVIFVGDVDQLQPIRAGAFLRDVIASDAIPVVRLERVYRQGEGSMISAAAVAINRGQVPTGTTDPHGEFFVFERPTPEAALATVVDLVTRRLPQGFGLDPVRDVAVLVPQHKGVAGTVELNARLQAALNPGGRELVRGARRYRVGDRVMQLRNDYDRDVSNGDIGYVRSVDPKRAELVVDFYGRSVVCDDEALGELTLAYASSIHKMQGGQAPAVVVYLGWEHRHMLSRKLFYTAVTRGERIVVVVGERRAIAKAVRERDTEVRRTRLAERLRRSG